MPINLDYDTLARRNVLLSKSEIVPHSKDIRFTGKRKYIFLQQISQLSQERGTAGITYMDLMSQFSCNKRQAQRKLKNAHSNLILFTAGDLISEGLELPVSLKNTRPQKYYATATKADIIDKVRKECKNVLLESTGTSHSVHPLSKCLEKQKASHLIDFMTGLPFRPLLIHKLIIKTVIDSTCYELINASPWKGNLGKTYTESIENRLVTYIYYKNGRVKIHVACSNKPFGLQTDNDLVLLYSFFGQVRDRLEYQISDPRGRLIPNITKWILEQCDFNKDVPITDKAQMTLPDIQLSTAFDTFRLYVKNLHGEAIYRCEVSAHVNQSLPECLASNINPTKKLTRIY